MRAVNDVLARARADIRAGRLWKARDRLQGALATRQDWELVDLLALTYVGMGDLPRAGALWFALERDDELSRPAITAWKSVNPNAEARLASIPRPLRSPVGWDHLDDLRRAAKDEARARWSRKNWSDRNAAMEYRPRRLGDRLKNLTAVAFVIWVILMCLIGLTTTLRWLWS